MTDRTTQQRGPGPARVRAKEAQQRQRSAITPQVSAPGPSLEPWWHIEDVQTLLRQVNLPAGKRTVYELARKHIIPARKIRHLWCFRGADVRAYAHGSQRDPSSSHPSNSHPNTPVPEWVS